MIYEIWWFLKSSVLFRRGVLFYNFHLADDKTSKKIPYLDWGLEPSHKVTRIDFRVDSFDWSKKPPRNHPVASIATPWQGGKSLQKTFLFKGTSVPNNKTTNLNLQYLADFFSTQREPLSEFMSCSPSSPVKILYDLKQRWFYACFHWRIFFYVFFYSGDLSSVMNIWSGLRSGQQRYGFIS